MTTIDEKPQEKPLFVKMSAEERDTIREEAQVYGMTDSDFIRRLVRKARQLRLQGTPLRLDLIPEE